MTRPTVDSLTRDPEIVAAALPADDVFGVLNRAVDLPPLWLALSTSADGSSRVHPAGSRVAASGVDELMIVRSNPLPLTFDSHDLLSADGHTCSASVVVEIRATAESSELAALRQRLLGRQQRVLIADLHREFQAEVLEALQAFASSRSAAQLVGATDDAELGAALAGHLQPLLFKLGLVLGGLGSSRFDSAGYRRSAEQLGRAQRRLEAQQAHAHLAEAVRHAQRDHVAHLEALLGRLHELANQAPQAPIADLIRSFDATQRGQIYEALGASHVPEARTAWIAVAAGHDIVLFDPRRLERIAKRIELQGPTGGLRSLCHTTDRSGRDVLLAGSATGAMVVDLASLTCRSTHSAPRDMPHPVRGGFNAMALAGESLFGTHSELGLIRWPLQDGVEGQRLLEQRCAAAHAVRHATCRDDTLWITVDDRPLAVPVAASLQPQPPVREYRGCNSTITALAHNAEAVFAGNTSGEILRWPLDAPDQPQVIRFGQRRAVESIVITVLGGVERLFFTSTSTAVVAEVLGDTFACHYEAGGQTLRRVEVAPDCVVATNETRDRLLFWPIHQPSATPTVVPLAQLTGHSIQDICLVPLT